MKKTSTKRVRTDESALTFGSRTDPRGGHIESFPVELDGGKVSYDDGRITKAIYVMVMKISVDEYGRPRGIKVGGTDRINSVRQGG